MKQNILKVHPSDNVLVALTDLQANEQVIYQGKTYTVKEQIPAKHKFAIVDIREGGEIIMYGVLVGRAQSPIAVGGLISTANVKHAASSFLTGRSHTDWHRPDISKWEGKTFNGYHRE
ncbi:MAG TPA: UxaA family hydrolase, partial [Mucilaginibacter sp.]